MYRDDFEYWHVKVKEILEKVQVIREIKLMNHISKLLRASAWMSTKYVRWIFPRGNIVLHLEDKFDAIFLLDQIMER